MKIRQYLIIIFFFMTCLAFSSYSYFGHFDDFGKEQSIPQNGPHRDRVDESFLKNVNYFSTENTKPFLELDSSELSLTSTEGLVICFNPTGTLYRFDKNQNPLEPINFSAKNSRAQLKTKELFLENDVEIKMNNTSLKAEKMSILSSGEVVNAYNNVKTLNIVEKTNDQIVVDSLSAIYKPRDQYFEFNEHVNGKILRAKQYEENIVFKSDKLTLDLPKLLANLKGNIMFNKGNIDVLAQSGEIFLENYNKRLKYYALYDDVRLQEKLLQNGKPLLRKAFAEKLEGLVSDKKIILTGFPKVFQDKDIIKGNRIMIRENVETVEVDDANTNIHLDKEQEKNKNND